MTARLKNDAIVNGVLYKRGEQEISEVVYSQLLRMGMVEVKKKAKKEEKKSKKKSNKK